MKIDFEAVISKSASCLFLCCRSAGHGRSEMSNIISVFKYYRRQRRRKKKERFEKHLTCFLLLFFFLFANLSLQTQERFLQSVFTLKKNFHFKDFESLTLKRNVLKTKDL